MMPTIHEMIRRAALSSGLAVDDITGSRGRANAVRARFAVIIAARNRRATALQRSYPLIGKALHRDHSTIMHGHRRARELLATDRAFRKLVAKVARP